MTSDLLQKSLRASRQEEKSPQSCFHIGLQKQIFPHLSPCVCSEIPAALPPSPFFTFLHFIRRCRSARAVFVLVRRPESPVDKTTIVFPLVPGLRWVACHHLSLNSFVLRVVFYVSAGFNALNAPVSEFPECFHETWPAHIFLLRSSPSFLLSGLIDLFLSLLKSMPAGFPPEYTSGLFHSA